jgi:hypothetical protein
MRSKNTLIKWIKSNLLDHNTAIAAYAFCFTSPALAATYSTCQNRNVDLSSGKIHCCHCPTSAEDVPANTANRTAEAVRIVKVTENSGIEKLKTGVSENKVSVRYPFHIIEVLSLHI